MAATQARSPLDITKAYKCKVCPYMTRFKSNLLKHIRVHTGEKPFACQYCGKRFSSRSNHKNHEERHAEQGQQYLRCPYDNCQFQAPQAETMQEHLVDKHPFGKLRIFRGADGSAVIREKGAYGNHMVEVGNLAESVELNNLTEEVTTTTPSKQRKQQSAAVNALNAVSLAGLTTGTSASQLSQQAAQLAQGLSLWNMAMPGVVTMNSVGALMENNALAAQLASQQHQQQNNDVHKNVINIAPESDDDVKNLSEMKPADRILSLMKSGRLTRAEELAIESDDHSTENGSNAGSNGNGTATDSETNDEMMQTNGSVPSPLANGKPSRRHNRRKASAPSHIRQIQRDSTPDHESGADASEMIDKLVDEGALYRCDPCNILFPEYSVYVLHLGCHGSGGNFECHFCKVIFEDKFGFLTHFTNCVKGDATTKPNETPQNV